MIESNVKKERNYGIDFLRILAMFFVVVLHCLGQGGILKNAILDSTQYKFSWFIEIFAYCAVNIFALVSGYVSYTEKEKKVNYSNYINIWLQVVFYGLLVTLIFNIINPLLITKTDYLTVLFPISNNLYWYLTAYTGLFVIMPFLNKGIRNSSINTMKKIFIVIILLFSLFNTIFDIFVLNGGYSFVWIALLYILGATIKKCNIGKNINTIKFIIGVLSLNIITYLYKIYGTEFSIFDNKISKDFLVSYTSPTILGIAILYVTYFSKIQFNNLTKNIIKFAAPSAFSVYILNNHRLIWEYVMKDLFINISNQAIIRIFVYIIGFAMLFVIISILIDKIRLLLFKILYINVLTNKVAKIFFKLPKIDFGK